MAKEKKVEAITSRSEDFARWYTDVVTKAELVDYSGVRGCMIYRPHGYAIWELIQKQLDERIKACGHENVYMPLFIPENLLQKEKDHVEGFAPEVAWVTHGGDDKLVERLCVRPTSETLFCEHYHNIIQSYRDLPKLYNQWCNVVRWEKTTRPFLRTMEFLWQEGHTAHATAEEAEEETVRMLNIYAEFAQNVLAMPVIKGQKTDRERFAGAKATYAIESLMHDGKALQAGTSHNFGDGFAKAFDIQYSDKDNQLKYVHQTSWGVTTRLIGGVIMVHSDDNGLVLPPKIAPVQVVVIPIATKKEGVLDYAKSIAEELSGFCRVKVDDSDKSPGWKFAEHEMRGVPIRIEVGPNEMEQRQVCAVRRDNNEKMTIAVDNLRSDMINLIDNIQRQMYENALKKMQDKTYSAKTFDEFETILNETPGFIKAMWCGSEECEEIVKEKTAATARCIPFEQETVSDTCICCGKKADKMVFWGRAY